MDLKVSRNETSLLRDNWAILYGRRKTGKTYLLRNFLDKDEYILIGREGTIWSEGNRKIGSFNELSDHVKRSLSDGKRIVIDEFQRIPMDHLEWMASSHPSGQLVLSGSSMGVVKKVLGPGSPLLGRFKEVHLSMISTGDLLHILPGDVGLDHAPYLSDPWTIPFLGRSNIYKDMHDLLSGTRYTVPSLVGEIFHEEDRTLSEIYQGILSSLGSGSSRPHEIATSLYSKGLIKRESASQISPYLLALKEMGIIEEIGIYKKKRKVLRFISPVMTFYYYIESKYGLERGLPFFDEMKENLIRIHSLCMEHYLVKAYAGKLGGSLRYSFEPEFDGIVVSRRDRPISVIEVKWKELRQGDINNFEEKSNEFDCEKIILTRKWKGKGAEGIKIIVEEEIKRYLEKCVLSRNYFASR